MVESKGSKLVFISWLILLLSYSSSEIKANNDYKRSIKEVNGFFIDLQGQKRGGVFLLPVEYLNKQPKKEVIQWKIVFIDNSEIKWELRPNQIQSFVFDYKNEAHYYTSIQNLWGFKNPFRETSDFLFCRIISKGEFNLYEVEIKGVFNSITFTNLNGTGDARSNSSRLNKSIELIFSAKDQFILLHSANWRNLVKPYFAQKGQDLPLFISRKKFTELLESLNQKSPLYLM